jgi:hypothetical protein
MMRRLVLVLCLLSTAVARASDTRDAAALLPTPPRTSSGEVSFSEPVAPVPAGMARWTVALSALVGVADPFYDKVALFASIRHGEGHWAVEAFGGRAFSWSGPALDLCVKYGNCTSPSTAKLGDTPGRLDYIGGIAGVWRAAEGKLSIGGLNPLRFALETSVGAAFVRYHVTDIQDEALFGPGARVGVGVSAGLSDSFDVRFDVQGLFYRSEIRGSPALERELLLGATVGWRVGSTR